MHNAVCFFIQFENVIILVDAAAPHNDHQNIASRPDELLLNTKWIMKGSNTLINEHRQRNAPIE